MKLNRLVLDNFRMHEHIDIKFEKDITIIVGDNGEGKTSILDAIAQLFGRLLSRLPSVIGTSTRESDLRIIENGKSSPGFRIWMDVDVGTEVGALENPAQEIPSQFVVSRSRLRDKSLKTRADFIKYFPPPTSKSENSNLGVKALDTFADALTEANIEERSFQMPLIVYYGTGRAIFQTPLRRRNFRTKFPRFDSLNGALNPSANFKRVFEWFHAKETEESFIHRKDRSFEYSDQELATVRRAIEEFFEDFSNPRTVLRPLRFVVDKKEISGKTITFDLNQLSDGYRTTLAMIADLACRMVEANPVGTISDPLHTEALVLIDEVDLHLHPRWQQKIALDLKRVFPNTQFIMTTHSAQVLTTVEARCIRKLVPAPNHTDVQVPNFSLGAQSWQLMNEIQEVNSRPDLPITKKLIKYQNLVENDKWDTPEAIKLRKELDAWAGNQEATLKRIDINIRMREYKRGSK
jgi:predicted ATP-binding protein involved in virulence